MGRLYVGGGSGDIDTGAGGGGSGNVASVGGASPIESSGGSDPIISLALPGQTEGDILYFDGTAWTRLPAGVPGQVLTTEGAGAPPEWATPAGGGGGLGLVSLTQAIDGVGAAPIPAGPLPQQVVTGPIAMRLGQFAQVTVNTVLVAGGSPLAVSLQLYVDGSPIYPTPDVAIPQVNPAGSVQPYSRTFVVAGLGAGAHTFGLSISNTNGSLTGSIPHGTTTIQVLVVTPTPNNVYNYSILDPVVVGDAVTISGVDTVAPAQANSNTTFAVGFVASLLPGNQCVVQYDGELAAFVGLTAGDKYFLSDTVPGGITTTAPSNPGDIIQTLGVAKDATTFAIEVEEDFIQL